MSFRPAFESGEGAVTIVENAKNVYELLKVASNDLSETEQAALSALATAVPGSDLKQLALGVGDERYKRRALILMAETEGFESMTDSVIGGATSVEGLADGLDRVPGIRGNDGIFYPGYVLSLVVKKCADKASSFLKERSDIKEMRASDFEGQNGQLLFGAEIAASDQRLMPPKDFGLLEKMIELVNAKALEEALAEVEAEFGGRDVTRE